MFNGTQCVPQQITETYLLQQTVESMARVCVDSNTSTPVTKMLSKLNDNVRFAHNRTDLTVGKGKPMQVNTTASETIAIQNLLGINMTNRCGFMYYRFIHDHKIFSSVHYTRAKRHSNSAIMFKGERDKVLYGNVLSLLKVKPNCSCTNNNMQYCNCEEYSVVLVKQMSASNNALYKDADFNFASTFLVEVFEMEAIVALFPEQILRKCILMCLENRKFVCPLPYRIYGD